VDRVRQLRVLFRCKRGAYAGNYSLNVQGTGGYSGISQNVNYTGTTSVSNAGAVPVVNYYDIPMSDISVQNWNWLVNIPGQYVQNWTVRSTTPGLTGSGNIVIWTYSSTHGHVDSVKLDPAVWTPPVADFTASQTSGTIPFTVQFTDTSTNSPTSWSWTFGDGGTSYLQNPSHQYTTAGTHNVTLTATNSDGSSTRIKPAYIMGTGGTYTVFVEGVTDYHGWQDYLGEAVPLASSFYSTIAGTSGDTTWTGYYEHNNDDTGSKYWNVSESSAIKADNADFALFAGHGWDDRIYFGTNNSVRELVRGDMEFGESKAKWVTLSACRVLNQSSWTNWKPVFNGLHILNGYDTIAWLDDDQGTQFAQRMTGDGYSVETIRDAWKTTLKNTINADDTYYNGAWMWAEPCKDDYLPGYGKFCSAPIVEGNGYNVSYGYFDCV
jgi:PKD repeat protein